MVMTDPTRPENPSPTPDLNKPGEKPVVPSPETNAEPGTKKLTPDEQMALYEEHLKETDWGHQPC
jgi:hypothetical protein